MSLLFPSPFCTYCGLRAHAPQKDHFIPISKQREGDKNFEVVSCARCNNIAGSRRFETFTEKWEFVQAHRFQRSLPIDLVQSKATLERALALIPNHIDVDSAYTKNRRTAKSNRVTQARIREILTSGELPKWPKTSQ